MRSVITKKAITEEFLSLFKMVVITVLIAAFINNFIIVNASIPTGSMERTIMPRDRIIAFRFSYWFQDPERFEIIIFRFPDDETELYVKRIIGMPGETVNIRDGLVYINDSETPLRDDFVNGVAFGNFGPFEVPEDSFFVLGDNRGNSEDSRAWNNPYVRSEAILGRAVFKYFRGIGLLH